GEVFFAQFRQVFGAVITAQILERTTHAFETTVYGLQVVEQLTNGPRNRVRHVFADAISIEAEFFRHRLALGFLLVIGLHDDPPRNADHRCTGRHRLGHHRIGTNLGPGTDRERPENLGARPYHYAVFQRRVALAFIPAGAAEGHTLVKRDVIADLGGFADHNAHAVVDKEAPTDPGPRMDLDPGQPATEVRHYPRQ